MTRFMRSLGIGIAATACVVGTATSANAAGPHYSASGAKYAVNGCTNHVQMWTDGATVQAFSHQTCDYAVAISRPQIVLSGNNGVTMKIGGKACKMSRSCYSGQVSVPLTKGWTYRAAGAGNASMNKPGEGDIAWPDYTVARVTKKAPF